MIRAKDNNNRKRESKMLVHSLQSLLVKCKCDKHSKLNPASASSNLSLINNFQLTVEAQFRNLELLLVKT